MLDKIESDFVLCMSQDFYENLLDIRWQLSLLNEEMFSELNNVLEVFNNLFDVDMIEAIAV